MPWVLETLTNHAEAKQNTLRSGYTLPEALGYSAVFPSGTIFLKRIAECRQDIFLEDAHFYLTRIHDSSLLPVTQIREAFGHCLHCHGWHGLLIEAAEDRPTYW